MTRQSKPPKDKVLALLESLDDRLTAIESRFPKAERPVNTRSDNEDSIHRFDTQYDKRKADSDAKHLKAVADHRNEKLKKWGWK